MKKPRPPKTTELQIAKMEFASGDVALVKVHHPLSQGDAEHVQQYFSRFLPTGVKIAVIDSNADVSIVKSSECTRS